MKRVVITGCGLVTPLGRSVEEVWRRIVRGESGIKPLTEGPLSIFRAKMAGLCDDFSTDGYMEPKNARRIDRFTQFALVSAIDAVRASGLDFGREDPYRCGVVIGCGVGGLGEIEHQQDRLREMGPTRVSPFAIPKIMLNAAAGQVAIEYQLHGPVRGVATACASANDAMGEAYRNIALGQADVVIAGGTESAVTQLGLSGFCAMRALSERNDDPTGASRPFDRNRDGFVLSEGAGILVFEEREHALKRGAPILGELLGYGASTDARHITQPDQDGVCAARAIASALESAGLAPDEIDYINAHGTGTILGDIAETAAIHRTFGSAARSAAISGTKSQLGHLLGGSGGVELIITLLAMRDGIVPPTINLTEPDPQCDLDFTPGTAREKKIRRAISNSFGFGGHNACIVVGGME